MEDFFPNDVSHFFILSFWLIVEMKLSVLQGRFSNLLFEKSNKVIIVGKSTERGDLRDVESRLGLQ